MVVYGERQTQPFRLKHEPCNSRVMPGLVPGIHAFLAESKTWMAGTSPAMTSRVSVTQLNYYFDKISRSLYATAVGVA
jgi:hypothetical protein